MPTVPSVSQREFNFEWENTALIIVDMQRDFVETNGACGAGGLNVDPLQDVIPRIQSTLALFRQNNAAVVHTRYGFKPDMSDLSAPMRQQSREAGGEYGTPGPLGRILTQGEPGFQIIPELEPKTGETIIDKSTFGAFTYTELDTILRGKGITHVVVCGVTTQCCVEGTLREAVDRGYYVLTLADCCGAFEEHLHQGTLTAIQSEAHLFGWIADSDALIQSSAEATA
ncbi:isochorismatase family cysteine hydrolase [Cognatishimia sp. 1_MG-2023]|uniref:cysteine hydrolase family protein n=1 Tax=Cognatishimia sp. 1_MG-2023 TaxID=3062642 RepID=UPI0026E1CF7E|nr:isochorismatase family cysteine hydrolase [Cognatishimia sp. 1_MG-2023]MDO6728218.1 isochorismatase family cysteine hydrolase [Cognatishimia sp. 1_MG-2023]